MLDSNYSYEDHVLGSHELPRGSKCSLCFIPYRLHQSSLDVASLGFSLLTQALLRISDFLMEIFLKVLEIFRR
jgi:predicted adenine nucleotide alpha hydrolase (AANH) superfamily ATPase